MTFWKSTNSFIGVYNAVIKNDFPMWKITNKKKRKEAYKIKISKIISLIKIVL